MQKSPDKASGDVFFDTGIVNWGIPDQGYLCWHPTCTDAIPAGAYVTEVEYSLRIDDDGSSSFYCVDYEIWLSNTNHGFCAEYLCVYNNHGGTTDGGYDDDTADDTDIFLNYRTTTAFNGESPNQQWMIYIEDNIMFGKGILHWAELAIYWEAPECDLVATYLTLTETDWQTGESITAGLTEYNYGPDAAGAHNSRLYLSENTTITTADVLLGGDIYFSSVAAGSSVTHDHSFMVPDVANGTYYVGIMVDFYDDVPETDETNNITYRIGPVEVNNPADLVPTWLYLSSETWDIGSSITADLVEENWGAKTAGDHYSRIYLSTNNTITTSDIQLGSDLYFSSIVAGGSQTVGSTFTVPSVSQGWYYLGVMVDFYDAVYESDEANNIAVRSAQVYIQIPTPSAPTLLSPANSATCQPTEMTFNWTDPGNADSYGLQVDDNSDFSSPVYDNSGIVSTSQYVSGLGANTTYYWRVNATNGGGTSGWSAHWSFTTGPVTPSAPGLSAPANGTNCMPQNVTLLWNSASGASYYQVQVDDNSGFSSPDFDVTGIGGTSHDVSGLSQGTTYYWRVKTYNSCDVGSSWSSSWSLTVTPVAPGTPALSSPANGATDQPLAVNVTWNYTTGADSYQLQVDDDNSFGSPMVDQSGISTNSSAVSGLTNSTTYYWRVKAFNDCGAETAWSDVWNFVTVAEDAPDYLTDVSDNGYLLGQNYPNPFNHSTSIDFIIPVDENVIFEILDINGRTISIFNDFYEAGQNSITIEFYEQLSNGVYFYRMKTTDYIQTKVL